VLKRKESVLGEATDAETDEVVAVAREAEEAESRAAEPVVVEPRLAAQ
jgi:hypothetical protein